MEGAISASQINSDDLIREIDSIDRKLQIATSTAKQRQQMNQNIPAVSTETTAASYEGVNLSDLFSYSSKLDIFFMVIGSLAAFITVICGGFTKLICFLL